SFHALDLALGVGDDPLARNQLRGFGADVRDPDVIFKEVLGLLRRAPLRHIHALNRDPDAARRSIAGADAAGGWRGHAARREAIEFVDVFGLIVHLSSGL